VASISITSVIVKAIMVPAPNTAGRRCAAEPLLKAGPYEEVPPSGVASF
jgi:hypothetical protein